MAARIVGLLLMGVWFLPALAPAQQLVVEQGPPADRLTVAQIRQKLSNTDIELDLVETPLQDAIDHLEDLLQLPIHLDRWAVADAGVKLDSPVSLRVRVKALSALRLMLREQNLDYLLEPGRIVITSGDEAATRLQAKFYPVADLVTPAHGGEADFRPLAELLTYSIEPFRWEDLGGPGSFAGYDGGIVVTQSDAIHEKVEHLLAVLREVKSLKEGDSLEARSADPEAAARSQLEQKIAQTHVTLALEETPLTDFLELLRTELEIAVNIDHRGLKDARKKPDLPLSGRWRQMPLETVLNDLFRAEGLSWFASSEVLVVTSYQEVCGEEIPKVYPVFDLFPREHPVQAAHPLPRYGPSRPQLGHMSGEPHPYDRLIDMLFTQIDPESWEAYGGPGTVVPYEEAGALVVSQSREVHQKVADLLRQIREQPPSSPAHENANDKAEGEDAAADPITVTYLVHSPGDTFRVQPEDLPKVVGRIMRVIAPGSWQDKAHYVEVLSDRLIICHRPHVHRAIEEYLIQAMIIPPPVRLGDHGYFPELGGGNPAGQNGASKSGPAAGAPNGASDPAAVPQTGGGFF